MGEYLVDKERGNRLREAMIIRGNRKAMALAAELEISPAAITKWKQGHAMSVDNACSLARSLEVSLDWLLMGRNSPEWLQPDQLSDLERVLIEKLRMRSKRVMRLIINLISELPEYRGSDLPNKQP